ncbi:Holliday junction branch migration protein RuvA [Desulfococcaceae bacterium HSG9]|nr:Holliday junction branch migration protein RuvA [Desulfococcaceae bacterium HSG9]
MIGYLEGTLLKKEDERILLLANQVGYEVLVPAIVMEKFESKQVGDHVAVYIYFQQTDRQPKPVLIGFNQEIEKEFFQHFISVSAIGPLKAVKALTYSVFEIANAIEEQDVAKLALLKGIGKRTAQKIVATLHGKMNKFILSGNQTDAIPDAKTDLTAHVFDVLVNQLGHKATEAQQLIKEALKRNPLIATSEQLFEEVYSVNKER